MQLVTLQLSDIEVGNRLRVVNKDRAEELAVSLRDVGQITPIEVLPADKNGKYRLVSGAHRLVATRIAGGTTINALVFGGSEDAARLREIDENLYRHELSPFDMAAFLTERRAIYERVVGPVKVGRRKQGQIAQLTFFDDVFERFSIDRNAVKRAIRRRKTISDAAWTLIEGTKLAAKGVVLDAIGRLKAELQAPVVQMMLEGRAKTVRDALEQVGAAKPVDHEAQKLGALLRAWELAGVPTRSTFLAFLVKGHAPSLRKALKDGAAA